MNVGGERAFVRWLTESQRAHPSLAVPLGDDGAVWSLDGETSLVLVADALAEGTHFTSDEDPHLIGRKGIAVNLSDLAAMGARPLCALATCALPRGFDTARAEAITAGLRSLADAWSCPLVGGDTITHDGGLVLSVTVIGVPLPGGPITRDGASPGHVIAVTGTLGGSLAGGHLRFTPRLAESAQLVTLGPPSAMIDVSDGLLLDLDRLADSSGTGFRLDAGRLPVTPGATVDQALGDGEDFELLFAAPPEEMHRIVSGWAGPTPITVIGEMTEEGRTLLRDGRERPAPVMGYTHD